MEYKKRIIDDELDLKMEAFGATLIVGPKGCGKTTSAKQKAKSFVEFQDEEQRENLLAVAETAPSKLLIGDKPRLFDEWQDAPKLWGAIRKSVDDLGENGLYILTGSSSKEVDTPHTGTLRISKLKMYPMSLYESEESNGTVSLSELFNHPEHFDGCISKLSIDGLIFAICRGGWPHSLSNKTILGDVKSNFDIGQTTFHDYIQALEKLYIIEDIDAWCPAIRSKTAIRSSKKRNLIDPSIAVAALGLSPQYFNTDFKTLGFLFESLCIRDLKIYSSAFDGDMCYYRDRYGLEADGVLRLNDGRYALIEFKLGAKQIEDGAKHLLEIERLINQYNQKEKQCPLRLPDLKIVITGTEYGYKRPDGVFVIPIGCLKD